MSEQVGILMMPTAPLSKSSHYPGFAPRSRLLKRGHVHSDGFMPTPCDILLEQDVAVKMRDGITIYIDIYRPPGAPLASVPAIIAAGPFGKQGGPNRFNFDSNPWRCGVPRKSVSGLEKFEGPDPAYWCNHGYAVVHPDGRGSWMSEGHAHLPCDQEGKDGYDLIEWLALQDWSNGKVTMAGNSYLGAAQWFVGAENPPHLACLAPWEGFSDVYNDVVQRGGIPNSGFSHGLLAGDFSGLASVEDIFNMTEVHPMWNAYWTSRQACLHKIKVPLYVVASWTNPLHPTGTFRGFLEAGSTEKWLRVHNSHEWPDLYYPENVESLRSFYDYYMKGVPNGWQFTPKVKLCVLNPDGNDIVNRPEKEFPLARQESLKLYLDSSNHALALAPPRHGATTTYDALTGSSIFNFTTLHSMEITGFWKLRIWVEADGSNDMDIFVTLGKHNASGELLRSVVIDVGWLQDDPEHERKALLARNEENSSFCGSFFNSGTDGCLRVSHRKLDKTKSTDHIPVYLNDEEDLLEPREVVPVDIAIRPYSMMLNRGDMLRLWIGGTDPHPHLRPTDPISKSRNVGKHIIHTGRDTPSYLLLPVIP